MNGTKIPVDWDSLETAVERNASDTDSFLDRTSGQVVTIVKNDPEAAHLKAQVARNIKNYIRIDPASSREQYRWMERYIATVEDTEFRQRLISAIDGKGAFRRFKDVLMNFPVDRERWFTFRSERLRTAMEAWLEAHGVKSVPREEWQVPTAEQVQEQVEQHVKARPARRTRAAAADAHRARLRELCELLPVRELEMAVAFLEFLRDRRPIPRPRARASEPPSEAEDGADE
jgi:hypothetical protein